MDAVATTGGRSDPLCTADELARVTYELERVEEGRRRLRAALAEQRAAADAYTARTEADAMAEAAARTSAEVPAKLKAIISALRSRLDATSAEEDARAHDLCATVAALQLSAALASTEYRCMLLPLPAPAPAPASDLGLLGSWASWIGDPPEARLAADIADVQQRLSHVKSLVQETSLSSLLALAYTLLQRQNAPAVEAVGVLQKHATMAAGHAGALPEGESQPKDDVTPEHAAQPLLALAGSAAAFLEQVAGHRAEAAREMRDLAWQFRTLPLHPSVNEAPSAELQAQAREAVLSSELLAVEQQLLFCAAPMSDQLAANATAEQNAGLYHSRACTAERQLADARAGMAVAQKEAAKKEARAILAEERALMADAFLTRAKKSEAEYAALQKQFDEAPLPAWWRREYAKARAEAAEDDPDAAEPETPAAATVDRRGRKPRPRLEEAPEPRPRLEPEALVAQPEKKQAAQKTLGTSPPQGELAHGSPIDDTVAAAQPQAEMMDRQLLVNQSEVQLPRKNNSAMDMD